MGTIQHRSHPAPSRHPLPTHGSRAAPCLQPFLRQRAGQLQSSAVIRGNESKTFLATAWSGATAQYLCVCKIQLLLKHIICSPSCTWEAPSSPSPVSCSFKWPRITVQCTVCVFSMPVLSLLRVLLQIPSAQILLVTSWSRDHLSYTLKIQNHSQLLLFMEKQERQSRNQADFSKGWLSRHDSRWAGYVLHISDL